MTPKAIVDGFDTSTIDGCLLVSLGEVDSTSIRYVESTSFGSNGKSRAIEAFDNISRKLVFHVNSFGRVIGLVNKFRGLRKKIEYWNIDSGFYYFDYVSSSYKMINIDSWEVSVVIDQYPFRYLKNINPIPLLKNGNINNIGDVFSEPIIQVNGSGKTSLTIGTKTMHLNLLNSVSIDCRHGLQSVSKMDGTSQNSSRLSGVFFEIQPGNNGVVLGTGITSVNIIGNWRCYI